jgi:hypothetical protein
MKALKSHKNTNEDIPNAIFGSKANDTKLTKALNPSKLLPTTLF